MKRNLTGWLFAFPATVHLFAFALLPIGYAAYLAAFKINLLQAEWEYVGFGNFQRIFAEGGFSNALVNSTIYTVASVPLGVIAALGVAILVTQQIRGIEIFRTIYYLPAVCGQVAIAMIWIYIFLPKKGMINATLGAFGLPDGTDFLGQPGWAMAALVFMSIWTGLGPRMILFVSGLLNIPASLLEAAEIDGATPFQRFWRITLPLLAPTTYFVAVTSMIGAMQIFTPVYMMTRGGPEGSTDVVGYHIYSAAWERFRIGEASAMSFVLFGAILVLSILPFRNMARQTGGMFG